MTTPLARGGAHRVARSPIALAFVVSAWGCGGGTSTVIPATVAEEAPIAAASTSLVDRPPMKQAPAPTTEIPAPRPTTEPEIQPRGPDDSRNPIASPIDDSKLGPFDCASGPPSIPCCQAESQSCEACQADALAREAAWERACSKK